MTTRPYGADHTNVGQPRRKRDSISPQSLTILMMKRSGASPRGVSQLGTDTREFYWRSSRAYAEGEGFDAVGIRCIRSFTKPQAPRRWRLICAKKPAIRKKVVIRNTWMAKNRSARVMLG